MPISRLAFALEVVRQAGDSTMAWFQQGVTVERKDDQSPVTIADRHAERLVRQAIERSFPGESILGEEEGVSGCGDDRWVIDPIDGTKSFVAGVPLFATLLSYEQAGEPILGVAYLPGLQEMVWAEAGQGTCWNGEACRVSSVSDLAGATLATGSLGSMVRSGRLEGLLRLSERCGVVRGWTDAYGHLLVATGRVEAMIDPIVAHWDISAIKVIVEEAGGRFTDFSGRSRIADEAISSNAILHETVLGAFQA